MFPGLFGMVGGLSVAPLAGSVDRNLANWASSAGQALSLPSRGAWIEIS